ncbi:hypothetical protein HYV43_02225 [Candidatus Micrarchaeota archaeon]|nr:hypothetical protein [Candidatus Micrarchaeota archaeon]
MEWFVALVWTAGALGVGSILYLGKKWHARTNHQSTESERGRLKKARQSAVESQTSLRDLLSG